MPLTTAPRGALWVAIGVLVVAAARPALGQEQPPRFEIEGRLMAWGVAAERPASPEPRRGAADFLIRRARVVVQGRVTDDIGVSVQLGQDNVGAHLLTPDDGIRIKDAYVNWRAAHALQVAAGQFKIPFLRANLESAFTQILADRGTLPTLRPAREGSRDLGVMAWGNARRWQYRVALFDGSDQDRDAASGGPRVAARLAHNWFTSETGFGYTGSSLGAVRVLHVAVQADVQPSRTDPRDEGPWRRLPRDYRAYAVEAFYEQPLGRWAVTADGAWIDREDDYEDPTVPSRQLRGAYVQAGLLLPPATGGRLQVVARHEGWDVDRGAAAADHSRTSLGASYYLSGHRRKLQADYTARRETPEVDNDELRVSLVVVF